MYPPRVSTTALNMSSVEATLADTLLFGDGVLSLKDLYFVDVYRWPGFVVCSPPQNRPYSKVNWFQA